MEALSADLTMLTCGACATITVRVTNLADVTWIWQDGDAGSLGLGYRWWRGDEAVDEGPGIPLPSEVRPGKNCLVALDVQAPDTTGQHRLTVELVRLPNEWLASALSLESSIGRASSRWRRRVSR